MSPRHTSQSRGKIMPSVQEVEDLLRTALEATEVDVTDISGKYVSASVTSQVWECHAYGLVGDRVPWRMERKGEIICIVVACAACRDARRAGSSCCALRACVRA